MPRACTCCQHAERAALDAALVAGEQSNRRIAAQFAVSEQALRRHREHLPAALVKAQDAEEAADADSLLAQVRELKQKALGILDKAEAAGELKAAVSAIREARGCVELLAKLAGELDERPVVNVLLSPEWSRVRLVLVQALAPYPEARVAAGAALAELEAGR